MLTNDITIHRAGDSLQEFRQFINDDGSIAPGSAALYYAVLNKFHRWLDSGGLSWGDVSRRVVVAYMDELVNAGLKNSSINSTLKALKRSYRAMIEAGRAVENPVDGVKYLPESRSTKKRWLNESEARRLLRALDGRGGEAGARDKALVTLLLFSGLRASEAADLRWRDIEDGMITVRRGKGGKERALELHPKAAAALEAYAVYYRGEYVLSTTPTPRFRDRRKMTRHSIYCTFRRIGARLGLRVHPHMMRHSFASCALQNGCNVVALAGALGHADISMTLNTYSHTDSKVAAFVTF